MFRTRSQEKGTFPNYNTQPTTIVSTQQRSLKNETYNDKGSKPSIYCGKLSRGNQCPAYSTHGAYARIQRMQQHKICQHTLDTLHRAQTSIHITYRRVHHTPKNRTCSTHSSHHGIQHLRGMLASLKNLCARHSKCLQQHILQPASKTSSSALPPAVIRTASRRIVQHCAALNCIELHCIALHCCNESRCPSNSCSFSLPSWW